MKKEIKVEKALAAYQLLKDAKLNKIADDSQKFAVIKALRVLKPIATKFDSDRTDALEKLKGENHDAIITKVQQWQKEGENTTLTEAERIEINTYLNKYNADVTSAMKEEADKEVELELTALTDESMSQLVASNESWSASQALELMDVVCE